jgi:hypothetical protein
MLRHLAFLACVALLSASALRADASDTIPKDDPQFTAYVADAFVKSYDNAAITIDPPHTIVVVVPNKFPRGTPVIAKSTSKYDTTKLHDACVQQPANCQAFIAKFLNDAYVGDQLVVNVIEGVLYRRPDLDPTKILAAVLDDWTIANIVERNHGPYRRIAVKTLGSLWVGCTPNASAAPPYLVQKDLERLDMSAEDTIALCVKNTVAILPPFAPSLRDVAPGEVGVLSGTDQSLLILAHDQWGTVAGRFDGDLIVSVPDENTLLYSRGSGPLAIQAVVDRGKAIRGQRAPIVDPAVYKWTQSGWDIVSPTK